MHRVINSRISVFFRLFWAHSGFIQLLLFHLTYFIRPQILWQFSSTSITFRTLLPASFIQLYGCAVVPLSKVFLTLHSIWNVSKWMDSFLLHFFMSMPSNSKGRTQHTKWNDNEIKEFFVCWHCPSTKCDEYTVPAHTFAQRLSAQYSRISSSFRFHSTLWWCCVQWIISSVAHVPDSHTCVLGQV